MASLTLFPQTRMCVKNGMILCIYFLHICIMPAFDKNQLNSHPNSSAFIFGQHFVQRKEASFITLHN